MDNIQVGHREIGCGGPDWLSLA